MDIYMFTCRNGVVVEIYLAGVIAPTNPKGLVDLIVGYNNNNTLILKINQLFPLFHRIR